MQRTLAKAVEIASRAVFGAPDIGDWVLEKAPSASALLRLAQNLALYKLGSRAAPNIVSLGFEPVYGCNLRCQYCWGALKAEPGKQRPEFMSMELYQRALDTAPASVASANFVGWGEPLRNSSLPDMIDAAAERGLATNLTTNCTLLRGAVLERLAASKLTVLNVSTEPDAATAKAYRGVALETLRENVAAFAGKNGGRARIKLSVVVHPGNESVLHRLWQTWDGLAEYAKLIPMFSLSPEPLRHSLCLEPWRGHLTVLTDGHVTPCCGDMWHDLSIGNLHNAGLRELARSDAYRALRTAMRRGQLPERCQHCQEYVPQGVPNKTLRK